MNKKQVSSTLKAFHVVVHEGLLVVVVPVGQRGQTVLIQHGPPPAVLAVPAARYRHRRPRLERVRGQLVRRAHGHLGLDALVDQRAGPLGDGRQRQLLSLRLLVLPQLQQPPLVVGHVLQVLLQRQHLVLQQGLGGHRVGQLGRQVVYGQAQLAGLLHQGVALALLFVQVVHHVLGGLAAELGPGFQADVGPQAAHLPPQLLVVRRLRLQLLLEGLGGPGPGLQQAQLLSHDALPVQRVVPLLPALLQQLQGLELGPLVVVAVGRGHRLLRFLNRPLDDFIQQYDGR